MMTTLKHHDPIAARPQSAFSNDIYNGAQLGNTNSSSSPSLASILRDKAPTKKSVTLNDDKVDVHEFTQDCKTDDNGITENSDGNKDNENNGPVWDPSNKPEGTIWSRFERRRPMFRPHNHRYHVSSAVSVPNLSVIPEIEHDSSSVNDSTHSISGENSQRTDSRSTLSQSQSISFGLDLLPSEQASDTSSNSNKLAQASNISVSSSAISLSNDSERSANNVRNTAFQHFSQHNGDQNCHENVNLNRSASQHGSCLCLHSKGVNSTVGTLPSYVYPTPNSVGNGALTLDSAMRYRYLTFGSSTQLQREFYDKHPQTPAGWPSLAEFRFRRKLRRFKRQARKFIGNVSLKRFVKPNPRLTSLSTLNLSLQMRSEQNNPQMSRASSLTSLLDLIEEANQNLVNQYNRSPQAPPKCPPRKLKRAQSSINFSTLATKDSSAEPEQAKPNDPNATRARVQSILNDLGLLTKPSADNYRIAFINNDQRNRMQAQNGKLAQDNAALNKVETKEIKTVIDSNNNASSNSNAVPSNLPGILDAKHKDRNSKILCVRSHFEINNGTIYLEDSDWEMCSEISETLNSLGNMDSVVSIENNKASEKSEPLKSLDSISSDTTISPEQQQQPVASEVIAEEKHDCLNTDISPDPEETQSHASLNNSSGFGSETETESKEPPLKIEEKETQIEEKKLEITTPKTKVEPIYSRVQKPIKVSKPAKVDFKPKIVRHDCCGHGRKPTPIDTGLHNSHTESSRAKVVHSTGGQCHRAIKPKGPAPPPPPPNENRCSTESTRLCRNNVKPEVTHKKPRLNIKSALVTRGFIPSLKRKQTLKTVNENKNEKDETPSKRNRSPLLSLMDRFSPTKADSKVDNKNEHQDDSKEGHHHRSDDDDILGLEDAANDDCDAVEDDDADADSVANQAAFDSIENETFPDILPVDKTIYEEIQPRTVLGTCSVNELIEKFEQLPLKNEPVPVGGQAPVECSTRMKCKEEQQDGFGTFSEMEKQFNHYLSDLAPPGVDAQQLDKLVANLMKEFENKMTNGHSMNADCSTSAGLVLPGATNAASAQNSNFLLFFFLHNQRKMFKEILVEMMGTIQKQQQQQHQQQTSLAANTNESKEFKQLLNILQTNLQKQEVAPSSQASQIVPDVDALSVPEVMPDLQTPSQQQQQQKQQQQASQNDQQCNIEQQKQQCIENGNNASQTISSENRFVNKIVLNNSINQFNFTPAGQPTPTANIVNVLADACHNESQNTFNADITNNAVQQEPTLSFAAPTTGNESAIQVQVKQQQQSQANQQPSGEQTDEILNETSALREQVIVNKPHKTVLMITPGTSDGLGATSGSFFSAIRSRFEKKKNRKALEKFKKQQMASSQLNLLETIANAEANANNDAASKVTLVNTSTLEISQRQATPNPVSDGGQSTLKKRSATVQIGQNELTTPSKSETKQLSSGSSKASAQEKSAPTSKMSTLRRWLSSKDVSKSDKKSNKVNKVRHSKATNEDDDSDGIESEPELEIVKTLDHLVRRHRKSDYIPDVSEPLEWSQVSVRAEGRGQSYHSSSRVSISDSNTDRSLMGSAAHSLSGMDAQFDTSRAAKYRRRATGNGLAYRSASVIRLDDYNQHYSPMRNSDAVGVYNSHTAVSERRRRYGSQNNLSVGEHYNQHFESTSSQQQQQQHHHHRSTMRFESTSDDESEATTVSTCRSKIVSFHLPRNDRQDMSGKHHSSGRQTSMNYRLADEHYHRNERNFYNRDHRQHHDDEDDDEDDDDDDDDEDDDDNVANGHNDDDVDEDESNSDSTVEQASSDAETINTSSDDTNLEYYLTPSSRLNERYFRRATNYKTKYY